MSGRPFSANEVLTIGARSTASFTPQAITDTPTVSLQFIKVSGSYDGGATASSTINKIVLYGSNVSLPGAHGASWPSGSANLPYWTQLTGTALIGDLANICSTPPLTSGALGSAQVTVSGFGMKWLKAEVYSNTGGAFRLAGFGKE